MNMDELTFCSDDQTLIEFSAFTFRLKIESQLLAFGNRRFTLKSFLCENPSNHCAFVFSRTKPVENSRVIDFDSRYSRELFKVRQFRIVALLNRVGWSGAERSFEL